jgi:predicted metal-binding membrane protein
MDGMAMSGIEGIVLFLFAWTVMMVAMMVPATLPLILLYRTIARNRLSAARAQLGMMALLAGYVAVWAAAGVPVYTYALFTEGAGSLATVLPALLLVVGGIYQFTPLKRICHARCSSPLFFLMQNWRSGAPGALRLGVLHGVDCLGCCAGLMVGLVALGLMNLVWMLTAAVSYSRRRRFRAATASLDPWVWLCWRVARCCWRHLCSVAWRPEWSPCNSGARILVHKLLETRGPRSPA